VKFTRRMSYSLFCCAILLLVSGSTRQSYAQQADPTLNADTPDLPNSTRTTIAKVVGARSLTTSYVQFLAAQYKADSPEFKQGQLLYGRAKADYDQWNGYVYAAIVDGKDKKLGTDADYKRYGNAAIKSASAFTSFVESKAGDQSKDVSVLITSLLSSGVDIWQKIVTNIHTNRQKAADSFKAQTAWQDWSTIVAASTGTQH
jgi:hypothetical protein